jgi:adenine-specific DNA-methyltransferase
MEKPMTNNIKKVKDDLIAELDKRIVDKIIEKTNADLLKKLIEQAETINEAIMIAELGTTYKRTGFHFDKRLEKMTDTIKYFKKNKKLSFVQDKNALTHKLIIGDNYDALLNLLIEYRGKIDVIYIDPPYGKDSMGEFAQTNYENAITRDNLLSTLYPRLVLARQLLSDTGVIFCSIDDKNQAYVKGLFDEVFEERNFIASIVWSNKEGGGSSDSSKYKTKHEYILSYAKKAEYAAISPDIQQEDVAYSNQDEFVETRGKYKLIKLNSFSIQYSKSLDYPIEHNGQEIHPSENGKRGCWRWNKKKLEWGIKNKFIVFQTGQDGQMRVYTKQYFKVDNNDNAIERGLPPIALIDKYSSTMASKEIESILGPHLFTFAKPVKLLQSLIKQAGEDDAIILDFFAGSGTAGQAVLELNKQDGGKRQFILATANEITDTTPNGIVNDVTSKRLKRVMTGECYDGTKDFKWNEKNKPLGDNLDVYDIATVAPYSDEPFEKIDETLYGQEKLGVKEKIKWVCENFEGTQKTLTDK